MSTQFGTTDVTSDDKLWAALAYVFSPIVPIIIFLMEDKKNRPFLKFHAVQSLIAGLLFIIIASVTVGCGSILWIIMLFWAYKAYQGEMVTIPVLTDFIKNQGWA